MNCISFKITLFPSFCVIYVGIIGFLTDTNGNREKDRGERDGKEKDKDFRESSSRDREKSTSLQRVRIIDANLVYDGLNLGRRYEKLHDCYGFNWCPTGTISMHPFLLELMWFGQKRLWDLEEVAHIGKTGFLRMGWKAW